MHTKLTNEQQQQNPKPGIQSKCLLKLPTAKYMLFWGKKASTHSLTLKRPIKLKALKL